MTEVGGGTEGCSHGTLAVTGHVGRETGIRGKTEGEFWVSAVVSHT